MPLVPYEEANTWGKKVLVIKVKNHNRALRNMNIPLNYPKLKTLIKKSSLLSK